MTRQDGETDIKIACGVIGLIIVAVALIAIAALVA